MTLQAKITVMLNHYFENDSKSNLVEISCPRNDDKHFLINITSSKFKGLTRIQKSRLVYKIIDPLLKSGELHAVTLNLKDE